MDNTTIYNKYFHYKYTYQKERTKCDEIVSHFASLRKKYKKHNKKIYEKGVDYKPSYLLELTHLNKHKRSVYQKHIHNVVIYTHKGIFKIKYHYQNKYYVFAESKREKNKILVRIDHKTIDQFDIVDEFRWFNYGCLESGNTLSNYTELVANGKKERHFGMVFMIYLLADKYFSHIKNKEPAETLKTTKNFKKLHKIFNKSPKNIEIETTPNITISDKQQNTDCKDM